MANQTRIFHIHISEMTSKSQYEKNLDAFAPYYYDDENHIEANIHMKLVVPKCHTRSGLRCFHASAVRLWNELNVDSMNISG
jgi:hypothetical protein